MMFLKKNKPKEIKKEQEWKECRCPHCGSLLFEIDEELFKKESIRMKCRKCKAMLTI